MSFSFFAQEAGRIHVCGHRGYSEHYPENTLAALRATKRYGGTTVELDVVLSRDGEPMVIHDLTLDRTTDGHGFCGDHSAAAIRRLDAGRSFSPTFTGERVPTLQEALDWAVREDMGLVIEIKEQERVEEALTVCAYRVRQADALSRVQLLSFDHVAMARLKQIDPEIRTELITQARHPDLVRVVEAAGAQSVSIELAMFDPKTAAELHEAGYCNRVHLPRPSDLAVYWRHGRDLLPQVRTWLRAGLIDTLSGDDVAFLSRLTGALPGAGIAQHG